MLPKTLEKMLESLACNGIRSWQIYTDSMGISLRIRFLPDGRDMAEVANVDMIQQGSDAASTPTPTSLMHTAYARKTPSQMKRDQQRKILKVKKRKHSREDSSPEILRAEDSACHGILDTPEKVCDRSEDTVVVPPSPPLIFACLSTKTSITVCEPADTHLSLVPVPAVEIDFENSVSCELARAADVIMKNEPILVEKYEGRQVLCPNCDVAIKSENHVCDFKDEDVLVEKAKTDDDVKKARDRKCARFVKSQVLAASKFPT